MSKTATTGLKDRILQAKLIDELDSLSHEGDDYKYASNRTRNRWRIAGKKRRIQLREEALSK